VAGVSARSISSQSDQLAVDHPGSTRFGDTNPIEVGAILASQIVNPNIASGAKGFGMNASYTSIMLGNDDLTFGNIATKVRCVVYQSKGLDLNAPLQ
jgi:hypothetical protein